MNILQKALVRLLGLKEYGPSGLAPGTYTSRDEAFARMFGNTTYVGKNITPDVALQISTVYACVRVLAETIGSLPLHVYEVKPDGTTIEVDHSLYGVLSVSPNTDMTSVEYREALITNLGLQGNTYSFKDTDSKGRLVSLYPIPSSSVEPVRRSGTTIYKVNEGGQWREYPQDKIWHVKGFGGNGLVGYSPINYARQVMGVSLASEEFQAKFFASGANPSWIVSIPDWLEEDQRVIARENINRLWGGLDNAHKAQLLEGGMTATAATMPLQDAQFLQLRGLSRDEICAIYRMPPHMVANLERSTNNNIEQQSLEFVMYTLMPYLTRLESSATKWLLPVAERSKYQIRFNFEGLLRADAAARAQLHSTYVQNGIMSRNEVRAIERLNRVEEEGMDDYTVQTNMTPVDKLAEVILAQTLGKPGKSPSGTPGTAADDEADPPEKAVAALMGLLSAHGQVSVQGGALKSGDTVINLPDSIKHELIERIEMPGYAELAKQLMNVSLKQGEAVELVRKELRALAASVHATGEATDTTLRAVAKGFEKLALLASAEREIVTDDPEIPPMRTRVIQ